MNPGTQRVDDALRGALLRRMPVARAAARQASEVLAGHFGRVERIEQKGEIDLVTEADVASEAVLLRTLRDAFPGDAVLAEESDGLGGAAAMRERAAALPFCWVLDPLDGTTNYAFGYPVFTVSVGLLHHGEPVLGVLDAPALGRHAWGSAVHPAQENGALMRVKRPDDLAHALIATGFSYDRRERLDELLPRLGRIISRCRGVRRAGAAAVDLMDVAAGRISGYYEDGLAPWDLAGGAALVLAAGGQISDMDGGPADVFSGRMVASGGPIHDALVALMDKRGIERGGDAS
jgi:myo-inositol-1(or 4)-monophosphatase